METLKQFAMEVLAVFVEWTMAIARGIVAAAKFIRDFLLAATVAVLFTGAVVGVAVMLVNAYRFGFDRERYALQYWVPEANVLVDPEPHDCEFLKAPVGSKYCRYDKVVNAVTERGQRYVIVMWIKRSD